MEFSDLVTLISTATPDQIQHLREMVAPVTKLQRLQTEAQSIATQAQAAISRVNDMVARFSNSVQAGDLTAVCPTMDQLVDAFRGN
jgi:hypothetical protein